MLTRTHTSTLGTLALLLWSLSAFAQEPRTVLTSLSPTQRQGVIQTGSALIPTDATGYLRILADIPDSDYLNTDNKLWLRIYRFDVSTQTWKFVAGHTPSEPWVGGPTNDPELGENWRPYAIFNAANFRGQQLRAELDVPTRMRIGVVVDIGPTPVTR